MSRIVFHSSDRPLLSFFHHLRQSYFVSGSVLIIYFCLNFGPGLDVLWVLFLHFLSSYIPPFLFCRWMFLAFSSASLIRDVTRVSGPVT